MSFIPQQSRTAPDPFLVPGMPPDFSPAPPPAQSPDSIPEPPETNGGFRPALPAIHPAAEVMTRQSAALAPEAAADVLRRADRTGCPPDLVARNRDTFREMARAAETRTLLADAPAVRGLYAASPAHAALLRDDLDNACGLEQLLRHKNPAPATAPASPGASGPETVPSSAATQAPAPEASADAVPRLAQSHVSPPQGLLRRIPRVALEGVLDVGDSLLHFLDGLGQHYTPDEDTLDMYLQQAPQGGTGREALRNLHQSWERAPLGGDLHRFLQERRARRTAERLRPTGNTVQDFVEDVVRMGPQVAAQMGVYGLGGWIPAALFNIGQIAGGQYAALTDDEVNKAGTAFLASMENAVLQAPFELLKTDKLLDVFKASGAGRIVKAGGAAALTSFVTEWMQKYPEALTSLWAQTASRDGDIWDTLSLFFDNLGTYTREGMYEGAVASVYGMLGSGSRLGWEYRRYKAAAADEEFFSSLDDSAKGSKTRARLPDVYARLVDDIIAHGPIKNVYVSPEALRRAAGDAAFSRVAETMGLRPEDIAYAEKTGTDLEIPFSRYQAHIAGTDLSLALRDDIRLHPEGMSLGERLAFEKALPQRLSEALRRVRRDAHAEADLDVALAPFAAALRDVYGEKAVRPHLDILKANARIAADLWTEAGEPLTPAQVVTRKWNASPEVVDSRTPDIAAAKAALERDAQAWGKTIDAIVASKKKPFMPVLMLKQTPLVMHLLGADFRELYAAPHMFDGIFPGVKPRNPQHNVHLNITPDVLKQIAKAMADPIMVFDSERGGGRLVFMLDVRDANGATVIVPVELEGYGKYGKQINILTSAFAKERQGVPYNMWFVKQAGENLRYINQKKTERWSRSSRVQFPFVRLSNASGKEILTQDDLVKLKEAHPGLYQPDLDVEAARAALERDVRAWEKSVDAFTAQILKKKHPVTMLQQTPLVLQLLGAKNRRIITTWNVLQKVLVKKHKLPIEAIKQVPSAMADPIMIFKSATEGGDLVIMLDIKDQHGATVIVPIALEQNSPTGYVVNTAPSIYSQKNDKTFRPKNEWFATQIKKGNLLYRNAKKAEIGHALSGCNCLERTRTCQPRLLLKYIPTPTSSSSRKPIPACISPTWTWRPPEPLWSGMPGPGGRRSTPSWRQKRNRSSLC